MGDRLDAPNYKALANFRFQLREFLTISSEAAKEAGIDPTQHQLLLVIKGLDPEPTSVGDIADWLMIRHNSAVELVKRCERNGWVTRERGEDDRRQVFVNLTDKGEDILADLSTLHQRELRTAGPRLIAALQAILEHDPIVQQTSADSEK